MIFRAFNNENYYTYSYILNYRSWPQYRISPSVCISNWTQKSILEYMSCKKQWHIFWNLLAMSNKSFCNSYTFHLTAMLRSRLILQRTIDWKKRNIAMPCKVQIISSKFHDNFHWSPWHLNQLSFGLTAKICFDKRVH